MDTDFIKNFLTSASPFNRLKPKEIEALVALSELHEYRNKDIIYKQGDPSDYFYLLVQGRVVALTMIDGKATEIELLKRGTIFGIISLFNDETHSVTAQAIENCWVMRVAKDRFKDFLECNPLIALDLSRILSQRVKARTGPKKIFQSRRIGVLGFASSGKTTYAFNLGARIKDATGKNIICIEVVSGEHKVPVFSDNKEVKPLDLKEFDEGDIDGHVVHDAVDYLLVRADRGGDISRLANYLSEQYHFIVCEIGMKLLDQAYTNFIYRCDSLHVIFNKNKIELTKGGRVIKDFEELHFFDPEKIKVVINEFRSGENIDTEACRRLVGRHIYATVPDYGGKDYSGLMRRIARETGEVVLGVALGSGGSYGFAHIGVLDVLEENGISVDIVCGSSMGAFVAALWAAGFDFNRMRLSAHEFGRRRDAVGRRRGVLARGGPGAGARRDDPHGAQDAERL